MLAPKPSLTIHPRYHNLSGPEPCHHDWPLVYSPIPYAPAANLQHTLTRALVALMCARVLGKAMLLRYDG